MKINFEELKMYKGISHEDYFVMDIREKFADVLYKNVPGIAALELARKIYKSKGLTDFSESEIDIINNVKTICIPQLVDAIDSALSEQNNDK